MNNKEVCKVISKCRLCGNETLYDFYHSPSMPVAGLYCDRALNPAFMKSAPMTLTFCRDCSFVQLRETVNPDIYQEYSFTGRYTQTYSNHLTRVAKYLVNNFNMVKKRVLEIGASDGSLLKLLKNFGVATVVGFEPSKKLCQEADKDLDCINDYFTKDSIEKYEIGMFDCVIMRHVLEHLNDPHAVLEAISQCTEFGSVLVIEVPDIKRIFQKKIYSNVFHEHLGYFSNETLQSLTKKHGFDLVESKNVNIHGGSMLAVFKRAEPSPVNSISATALTLDDCREFSNLIYDYYNKIKLLVESEYRKHHIISGYGASHRTFIILGNSGIAEYVSSIYDQNEQLDNKLLCGFNIPIHLTPKLANKHPDCIIIFAISYEDEIIELLRKKYNYKGKIVSIKNQPLLLA